MAVLFKKEQYRNPMDAELPKLYYPRLITLGQSVTIDTISWKIKERSSLSNGEVLSVLTNFVEVMRESLFAGQSVNIANFGIFSLTCTSEGSETEKDCTASNIKQVKIKFRPSSSIRISTTATRAGEKIEFVNVQTYLNSLKGGTPGEEEEDDFVDPTA